MTEAGSGRRRGGVHRITLDAGGLALSGLVGEPESTSPRAVLVALHGAGMNAGYFDGRTHPSLSLLTLGPSLGFTVLALDRPGYGASADRLPAGQPLADQTAAVRAAIQTFAAGHAIGGGILLLAHSFGGQVALAAAADCAGERLLGVDVSGCGHRYVTDIDAAGSWRRNWGPLHLYPPGTFRMGAVPVEPMPAQERLAAAAWPGRFHDLTARVRVPVRLTFAEHEHWWRHDSAALAELSEAFPAAPTVRVERQSDAGHNISLGWAARPYHLRVLAFLEDCLLRSAARTPGP